MPPEPPVAAAPAASVATPAPVPVELHPVVDHGDVAAEHAAVRRAVGVGVRDRAFLRFAGPHATRFLQGMVTQDVDGLAAGDARQALMLTPKARVVADLRLLRLADDVLVADTEPGAAGVLRATLLRYRLGSRVAVEAVSDWACVAVAGPRTAALVEDALGAALDPDAPEGSGTSLATSSGALHAVASALYGEPAVELLGPAPAVAAALAALVERLPAHGGARFGTAAEEVLRVEAGMPRWGAELGDSVMPAEAGVVERAVSFTKGCYIGQEPVARLHYRGHANRVLRSLVLDGDPPAPGTELLGDGDKVVGRVTSAVRSPSLARALALGIVRRELDDGSRVRLADEPERAAVVAPVPAYRRTDG